MAEPKLYAGLKDIGLKFMSNIVSFKYQTGVMVTVAFFTGLIPWFGWAAIMLALAGIKNWQRFLLLRANEEPSVEPTIAEE